MGIVLSAKDLKQGKKGEPRYAGAFMQPLQFLPFDEKTEDWGCANMDFLEYQGIRQLCTKAPKLAKNFNLAAGIIDRSDYVPSDNFENKELFSLLVSSEEDNYLPLRFYPIIPTFVNTVCNEFAQRNTKVSYQAVDEYSYNEMLELKGQEISDVLMREAEDKVLREMLNMEGVDPKDPKVQAQIQEQLSPENLRKLPEIESYYKKTYRSMLEEWAAHQHKVDVDKFYMNELEQRCFRNMVTTDEQYWHFYMKEDDYDIEPWNPMFTFVFKAPETRYTSQAFSAGNILLMTIPEVLDKLGHIMSQEQQESLELIYPATNSVYAISGIQPQEYYQNDKSHSWNVDGAGLDMRKTVSVLGLHTNDMVTGLLNQREYFTEIENYLVRVTTAYWKSQRKVGYLTKVGRNGEITNKIVDESYDVTDWPVYNTTLIQNRNTDTLVFGEHIEWIWINQVWGGIKIGPNIPSYAGMPATTSQSGLQPMYLGINQNKVGPLRYQFKGDKDMYGCKLPVEGATFTDYNTKSVAAIDLLKPFQIAYNVVNNQIADILMDELGTIVVLDQNQLPQHSLGEDWGKGNYSKAYVAMKNFNILPLDKSLQNTENGASSNAPVQILDASQTNRLLTKIKLANYFKEECLAVMGVTPQRTGQPTGRQTATGVEENLNASYNQTEQLFIQHSDYLMPRVHQMRTDLAQYYHSTKPSLRLQYMTKKEERVNFQINGTSLLLRDFNVYCTSDAQNRFVLEELKKRLLTNNTAGATIYELGGLMTADSLGEINTLFKGIEEKASEEKQKQYEQELKLQQQKDEASIQERKLEMDFEARQAEENRRRDVIVAEIRAAGYGAAVDVNKNQQNDFLDAMDRIQGQTEFQQTMNFEQNKESTRADAAREKASLERDKMNTQLRAKEYDLAIARENVTSSDLKAHYQKRKKEKEKKKPK